MRNGPERCILQCSSTQRFAKLSKVSISALRRLMITVINYLHDLLILENSMSEIFTSRDSGLFLLQHLVFVISLKKCVLYPVQEIELLGLILNSHTMTFSLPNEKIVKIKDQCLSFHKASEVSLLDLTNLIGTPFSTIQAVHPARRQLRFLQYSKFYL